MTTSAPDLGRTALSLVEPSSTPDVGPALERQRAMQRSSTRVAGGAPAVEFISFGRSSMNPFIDTLSPLRRPALG
ncbi:MAG: hypothetical protein ACRDGF_05525, partial [Chloroflexota bacterium]